jgi:hypothetical protein
MEKRSIILGMIIAVVVVAGLTGASTAIDKLNGPDTLEVAVERINDTHAAVSWTTEKPANGTLYTYTQHRCNGSWIAVNSVDDTFSRSHLVVAPIYELNRSRINQTRMNLSEENPLKQYMRRPPTRWKVGVSVQKDGSGAGKEIIQRNLSQTCQSRQ